MPVAQTVIRRLGANDIVLLRQLNAMFGDAFDDRGTFGDSPPGDSYVRQLLSKEHVIAIVALTGGDVVGGLVAYELDKLERMRREIYIYDLAVNAAHRRRGIATALIGEVRRIAAQRNAWVVYVQSDLGDDAAIALYGRLGVRKDVLHFDIPVEPGP